MPVCQLADGVALMPIAEEFHDRVAVVGGERLGFRLLPGGFGTTLSAWSHGGPVGYIEADYFGGVGEQRAAVWGHGTLLLGPLHLGIAEPFPSAGSPISQALRALGVRRGPTGDEFDAANLRRHRHMDDWFDEAG